ncbi:MAG: UvrD-helicase domain-containing protein [Deltaproteobacteria bacterium]|nr:MAG: UvrD-helicase domain-containing protein [Deltaproteobacteria bacterium]
MRDHLTFEQYCAFDCTRNMVVTAGPGSGKTRVLTERFCHIILTNDDVGIGEILALTFTEKAAEEMKARIYTELSRIVNELRRREGNDSAIIGRLKEALDNFSKNRIGTIHSFCAYLLRQYPVEAAIDPGFIIIQGLTQREMILKAIRSAISTLSQENRDDLTKLIRAFGNGGYLLEAIRNVIEHPITFKRILTTRDHLCNKKDWKGQVFKEYCCYIKDYLLIPYYKGLKQMKDGKGQFDHVMGLLSDWYKKKNYCPDDFGIPSLFAQLRGLSRQRPAKGPRLMVRLGTREISYLDILDTFYPDLFTLLNPDHIFEQGLNIFLELAEVALQCYQREKRVVNALDFADLEAKTLEFLKTLFFSESPFLMKRIQERFKYIMVDEFQDTNRNQWEIICLLVSGRDTKGSPVLRKDKLFVVGDKRQAIYRFRGADVTVFDAVTEEIKRSNVSNKEPFFWHNDRIIKGMLYKDQGLDKEVHEHTALFDGMPRQEREKILRGDIHLSSNFRSDSELIRFFNATFKHIFSNKGIAALKAYECEHLPIKKARSSDKKEEEGSVVFYLIPNQGGGSGKTERYNKAEREASLIADIINRMMGKQGKEVPEYQRYQSIRERIEKGQPAIGLLFFAYTHVKTFEAIFREAGLPFVVNKGKGFYRCEEVMEMVQLLVYLVDKRQRVSLLAALRGSIFALTDPEIFDFFTGEMPLYDTFLSSPQGYLRRIGNQLHTWHLLAGHLPIPELIRTIVRDRGLMASLSAHPNRIQRMANMEKLIEIARRFESEGNGSLPDFVSYCLRMAEEEDDEGEATGELPNGVPIHLMTIHAAKGLEFPMVIIPQLDRPVPKEPKPGKPLRLYPADHSRPDVWNDKEGLLPIFGVEFPFADFRRVLSPLSFILKRRDTLEDVAENRRVFYVGCTRTMHHLILTGHMEVGKGRDSDSSLTSLDYREGAPIMHLLDDIWAISTRFREDMIGRYPRKDEFPLVVWTHPAPKAFAGVNYGEQKLSVHHFGTMDDRIKRLDFTQPLATPSYYQLSPTGLAMFKRCPLKFYYRYWLRVPEEPLFPMGSDYIEDLLEDRGEGEAIEPRVIGTIVHSYLERHLFGSDLDQDLLEALFATLLGQKRETMLLDRSVLERMKTRVRELVLTAITDEAVSGLLTGVIQYSELPFVLNNDGYTLRGRIDKLFKDKRDDEWAIIDWKTGEVQDKDPVIFARENHLDLQLACYRLVVEKLENTRVKGMYLYFISLGRLVEIDYRGDPGKEIGDLIRFIETYKADPDTVGKSMKETKRAGGECCRCNYSKIEVC